MIRLYEKLLAIYHIIIDSEYIVFTITYKNDKRKRSSSIISDNAKQITIDASIDYLRQIEGLKTNKQQQP